jgi:hypothetical protein
VCGNPPTIGPYCVHHAGVVDRKEQAGTAAHLERLTLLALRRLEEIVTTGQDDAAIRSAKLLLDRTRPVARYVHVSGAASPVDGRMLTAADRVRARMDALAERHRQAEMASAATDSDTIIDAVLVDPPITVVQEPLSEPEFGATFGAEYGHAS